MEEQSVWVHGLEPYEPGQFYKRELPCVLALLSLFQQPLSTIVVDGYVFLGSKPGMGHYLWRALGEKIPVVGIAKNPWHEPGAIEVFRGGSQRPLYVTAVGIEVDFCVSYVQEMDGPYRIPTLLKRVDLLARST